jgi:hypothetical protein
MGGKALLNNKTINSLLKKAGIAGTIKEIFEGDVTVIDFVKMSMSLNNNDPNAPLIEIPVVGGLVDALVKDMVAESDHDIFIRALNKGYKDVARVMNSEAGKRSNLMGVYATASQMQSILANGSLDLKAQHLVGAPYGGYPDRPTSSSGKPYDFFILFPMNGQTTFKNFITLPINQ